MKATALRIDVLHECSFEQPWFGLVQGLPDTLRVFYERISPRYKIAPDQISVASANVLSDVSVKFDLFQGAASIELKSDRFIFVATRLYDKESLSIIKDVIALTYEAIEHCLPGMQAKSSRVLVHSWLEVEDGQDVAMTILERSAAPKFPLNVQQLPGDPKPVHRLKTELASDVEDWALSIQGEPSALQGAHLFLALDYHFGQSTKYGTLEEKVAMVEDTSVEVLNALGLSTEAPSE